NSREPLAVLNVAADPRNPPVIEVTGFEGQPFRMRALAPASSLRIAGAGPHLVSVDVAGEGGDEPPATVLLARFDQGRGTALAASAPRIAPGQAWRQKFNLRGPTSLLFEVTAAGPVAVRAQGPGVRASLSQLLGNRAPRADGRVPDTWDVEPGWYVLRLEPVDHPVGLLDLTFLQPRLIPEPRSSHPHPSI